MSISVYLTESKNALLAGLTDARISEVASTQPTLANFVNSFTDAFGRRVTPSVLLLRSDAPKAFFRIDALPPILRSCRDGADPRNRALRFSASNPAESRALPSNTSVQPLSFDPAQELLAIS